MNQVFRKIDPIYHFSLIYILLCTILALGGYLFCLDQSRYCNAQLPSLALSSPGSTACFMKSVESETPRTDLITIWWSGKEDYSRKIPVPATQSGSVCETYWLGTDRYGRDLYSRLVIGLRYSLMVSILSVLISLIIGVGLGSLAGYYGGWTDQIISYVINVFWSMPTILLSFVVLMVFGRNMGSIMVAIGLTMWGEMARLVRGQCLAAKEMNYVKASRVLGFSDFRILFRHILPNISGPIWIQMSSNFGLAILLESGLSFLGMGLQPPVPTLGNILQEQYTLAYGGNLMLAMIPVIVLVLLIVSFHQLTQKFRESRDVRLKAAQA